MENPESKEELAPRELDPQTKLKLKWMADLLQDYPKADEIAVKNLIDLYFEEQQYIDDIAEGKIEVPPPIVRNYEKTFVGLEIINDESELKEAIAQQESIQPPK